MAGKCVNKNWIVNVDYEDFEQQVLQRSREHPVLVDFWAEWCSPCLVIAPLLERVTGEFAGTVRLAKVEVDAGENMKLAGRYHVRGFPTLTLFIEGKEQGRFSGARAVPFIRRFLKQHGIDPATH
jgi:thioredoxin 1